MRLLPLHRFHPHDIRDVAALAGGICALCCGVFLLLLLSFPSHAAEPETQSRETPQQEAGADADEPSTQEREKPSDSILDESFQLIGSTFETLQHRRISRTIENLSQYLDSFYGDPTYYETKTQSYAAIRLQSVYARGGETDFDAKFKLRIDLPRTEERLKLRLEFDDEDSEFDDPYYEERIRDTEEDEDTAFNASLQYIIEEPDQWDISISPGGKLRDPIDYYLKVRFRRKYNLYAWDIKLSQTLEWYQSTGYGSRTKFYFDRPLGNRTLLRLLSQAYRNEEEFIHRNFEVSQRISLHHVLRERETLSTEVGLIGYTEPVWHHDRYYWNISFRRDVHEGFVYLNIRPQVDFRHANNFHGEGSISLSLEVLYGRLYLPN